MVEEKAGVEKQNSKKGYQKNELDWSVEGVLWDLDWSACQYLKVAGPTWKIQSSSKPLSSTRQNVTSRNPGHAEAHWHS